MYMYTALETRSVFNPIRQNSQEKKVSMEADDVYTCTYMYSVVIEYWDQYAQINTIVLQMAHPVCEVTLELTVQCKHWMRCTCSIIFDLIRPTHMSITLYHISYACTMYHLHALPKLLIT